MLFYSRVLKNIIGFLFIYVDFHIVLFLFRRERERTWNCVGKDVGVILEEWGKEKAWSKCTVWEPCNKDREKRHFIFRIPKHTCLQPLGWVGASRDSAYDNKYKEEVEHGGTCLRCQHQGEWGRGSSDHGHLYIKTLPQKHNQRNTNEPKSIQHQDTQILVVLH